MEEEDIEAWYEKEKEKLAVQFKEAIAKAKNQNIEKQRKIFKKKHKNLIKKYYSMYDKKEKQEKMKKKLHDPITKAEKFMDKMSAYFSEQDE